MVDFIKDKSLKAMIDFGLEYARDHFDGDELLMPTWLAVTEDDKLLVYATPYDNDTAKNYITAKLREEFKKNKVDRYCHISEAWVVHYEKGQYEMEGCDLQPSKHPRRIEVLLVQGAKRGHAKEMYAKFEIIRPANQPAHLSEPKIEVMDASSGRMTKMLGEPTPYN